jgi:hypothetical protein
MTLAFVAIVGLSLLGGCGGGGGDGGGGGTPPPPAGTIFVTPPHGAAWFWTGINITAGDQVSITATGTVNIGASTGTTTSGPDGWGGAMADTSFPLPNQPRFGLIGVIGHVEYDPVQYPAQTTYFFAGSSVSFTSTASGMLYLGVNDFMPWDNTGSYTATITHNLGTPILKTVPGHSGFWVDTGMDVAVGSSVSITASGTVTLGGSSGETSGPAGWSPATGNTGFPISGTYRYRLIGAIGDTSMDPDQYPATTTYFSIGSSSSFTSTCAGRLYLGVNDNMFWDNTGSYSVTVSIQ